MATSSREARRRRIVDRGSDRLALITGGRTQNPLTSSSPESHHSHTASCPTSTFQRQNLPPHQLSQQSTVSYDGEDKSSSSKLMKVSSASGYGDNNTNNGGSGSTEKPVFQKCETGTEAFRAPSWEVGGRVDSSQVSSTLENSSIFTSDSEHHVEPQVHGGKIFTPNQISSAIAASESTRIYCSLALAILVVLSHVGFPVLGSHTVRSIILFRPLYLVLLTNISIVLALLLGKQSGLQRIKQKSNNVPSITEFGFAGQVGKALESGLVLQNIIGALFMDCSIYTIVVVFGLSLAQKLGW